jgi:septal ring factor EnvC (AmiA/AmiB activator)
MPRDERRRIETFERLTDMLGPEVTAAMSELFLPAGDTPASQDSVDALATRTAASFEQVRERFAEVDQRFEQIDQRFGQIDQRFERAERRLDRIERRLDGMDRRLDVMDQRFDTVDVKLEALRHVLLGVVGGVRVAAVSGQTRAVVVAAATATFGIGGLAVTLSQLL